MQRLIIPILAAAALAACGGDAPQTTTPAAAKADISAGPLTGNSPGKPSVPVSLDYEFAQAPAVGQPLTVRLSVEAADGITLGDMRVKTRGALTLSNNTPAALALKTASGADAGPMRREIVVTPSDTGRSYVNVQISGTWQDGPFTKAIAIPVQVGAGGPVLETNGEIIDDGVEVLSSMPADQQLDEETPR